MTDWHKFSEWHWRLKVAGEAIDLWPTTNKYRWRGETRMLPRTIKAGVLFCPECGRKMRRFTDLEKHVKSEHPPSQEDEIVLLVDDDA
ncbi:MAG: hypothetical protein AAF661_05140 [Pseudomonadota bacterium]